MFGAIINRVLGRSTGYNANDLEAFLIQKGCTLVPFNTFLSNPDMSVMKQSAEEFKSLIEVYVKSYSPVFIFVQKVSGGKNYFILNNFFGMMTKAEV
jgi:hypothetical protein